MTIEDKFVHIFIKKLESDLHTIIGGYFIRYVKNILNNINYYDYKLDTIRRRGRSLVDDIFDQSNNQEDSKILILVRSSNDKYLYFLLVYNNIKYSLWIERDYKYYIECKKYNKDCDFDELDELDIDYDE